MLEFKQESDVIPSLVRNCISPQCHLLLTVRFLEVTESISDERHECVELQLADGIKERRRSSQATQFSQVSPAAEGAPVHGRNARVLDQYIRRNGFRAHVGKEALQDVEAVINSGFPYDAVYLHCLPCQRRLLVRIIYAEGDMVILTCPREYLLHVPFAACDLSHLLQPYGGESPCHGGIAVVLCCGCGCGVV